MMRSKFVRVSLYSLLGVVLSFFVLSQIVVRYLVWPQVESRKDQIATFISNQLAVKAQIGSIKTHWEGFHPAFEIQNIHFEKANSPEKLLDIPQITGVISWSSIWTRLPLFEDISSENISVNARRNKEGVWSFAGIESTPSGDNANILQWLLRVSNLHIKNIKMEVVDEFITNADMNFTVESFSLENKKNNHKIVLSAYVKPNQGLLNFYSEFQHQSFSDISDWRNWNGQAQWDIKKVNVGNLLKITKVPYQSGSGEIEFSGQSQFSDGIFRHGQAQLLANQVNIQWAGGRPPLKLQELRLNLDQNAKNNIQTIKTKTFEWQLMNDAKQQTYSLNDLNISITPDSSKKSILDFELQAPQLPLTEITFLVQSLPLSEKLLSPLRALQPEGNIDDIHFVWHDSHKESFFKPHPKVHEGYSFSGSLKNVGWQAWKDLIPGIKGISGELNGSLDSGTFNLKSQELQLQSDYYFANNKTTTPPISGIFSWKKKNSQWVFGSDNFQFKDAQNELSGKFIYLTAFKDLNDHLDLTINIQKMDATKLLGLIPKNIAQSTINYLRDTIVKGSIENSTLNIHGGTQDIPYSSKSPGEFKLNVHLKDASYRPVVPNPNEKGEWLAIDKVNADITIDNNLLNVSVPNGTYKNIAVKNITAKMDLAQSPLHIDVRGNANGPLEDYIEYLTTTPLGYKWQSQLAPLSMSGGAQLNLKIDQYLDKNAKTLIDAQVGLENNKIQWGKHPPGVIQKGAVSFDEKGIKAADIIGNFLGGPISIKSNPQNGNQIDIHGNIDSAQLQELFLVIQGLHPSTLKNALSGNVDIQGAILRKQDALNLNVNLDMKQTHIDLPQPFTKQSGEPMLGVIKFDSSSQINGSSDWQIKLGDLLQASGQTQNRHLEKVSLVLGKAVQRPSPNPINMAFDIDTLQLDQWIKRIDEVKVLNPTLFDKTDVAEHRSPAPKPLSIALYGRINKLVAFNRNFAQLNLDASQTNQNWDAKLNSPDIEGDLNWQSPNAQILYGAVKANFSKLHIPDANPEGRSGAISSSPLKDLPDIDLFIKNLVFRAGQYEEVILQANNAQANWNIDKFLIKNKNGSLSGNGRWEMPTSNTAGKSIFTVDLDTKNTGDLIMSISSKDNVISEGAAIIHGEINWQGSPFDFNNKNLNGDIKLEIKNGTILQVDPGAAKLLGILSLQSLLKFATLNFKGSLGEAVSSGTPFDKIQATANIRRGVIRNNDFELQSTLARITARGVINLNRETQDLRITIYPRINFGSASVAALYFVTPIIGITTMIGQYLFSSGINKALQSDLLVQGSWQNPEVIPLDQSGQPIDPEVLQSIRRKALLNSDDKKEPNKNPPVPRSESMPNKSP